MNRYTIHGEKIFPEEELDHLDGHKGSKPVRYVLVAFACMLRNLVSGRIGNGAIDHVQLVRPMNVGTTLGYLYFASRIFTENCEALSTLAPDVD